MFDGMKRSDVRGVRPPAVAVIFCGYCGIRGVLKVAEQRGLRAKAVDVRNSGDTSGTKNQVVWYGSYVIY